MKRVFIFLCSLFVAFGSIAAAEPSIESLRMWNEIDELMEKKSVNSAKQKLTELKETIKPTDELNRLRYEIYYLALDLGDARKGQNLYAQSVLDSYSRVKTLRDGMKDNALKAIASYYMANALTSYSHNLRRSTRSEVVRADRSSDMAEWSYNEIKEQALADLDFALVDIEKLIDVKVDDYLPLFLKKQDHEFNSVGDAIGMNALDIYDAIFSDEVNLYASQRFNRLSLLTPFNMLVPKKDAPRQINLLTRLVSAHKARGDQRRTIIMDMKRLLYVRNMLGMSMNEEFLPAIDSLIAAYPDNPAIFTVQVEKFKILLSMASSLLEKQPTLYADIEREGKLLMKKFPDAKETENMKHILAKLRQNSFEIQVSEQFAKGDALKLKVRNANVKKIKLQLYKVQTTINRIRNKYDIDLQKYFVAIPLEKEVYELTPSNYLQESVDEIVLHDKLDYGYYALKAECLEGEKVDEEWVTRHKNTSSCAYFMVSDLDVLAVAQNDNSSLVVVTDFKTGAPVGKSKIEVYEKEKILGKDQTDAEGFSEVSGLRSDNNLWAINIYAQRDEDFTRKAVRPAIIVDYEPDEYEYILVYTDRKIYRPLQTIKFKAIAYQCADMNERVMADKQLEVRIYDNNRNELYKQELVTDAFGTVTGEFTLPQGALLGYYSMEISCRNSNAFAYYDFRVEEYKRPTFEVTFDKVKENYQFGQPVQVKGRVTALSGEPMANAKVKIEVAKEFFSFWMYGKKETQDMQEVQADAEGRFEFTISPESKGFEDRNNVVFYTVNAVATNQGGETQQGTTHIWVADYDMRMDVKLPEVVEKKDDAKITVTAHTYNGNPQKIQAEVAIYRVLDEKEKRLVHQMTIDVDAEKSVALPISVLTPGDYQVVVKELTDNKFACSSSKDFIFYDKSSKVMPTSKFKLWTNVSSVELDKDESVELALGTTEKEACILEVVMGSDAKLISKRWIYLTNEMTTIRFAAKDLFKKNKMLESAEVRYFLVKNGVRYQRFVTFMKKHEPKKLNFSLTSFRESTTPGSQETWTIKFENLPSQADVLCGMYDASLDAYAPFSWNLMRKQGASSLIWECNSNYYGNNWAKYLMALMYPSRSASFMLEANIPLWTRFDLLGLQFYSMKGFVQERIDCTYACVAPALSRKALSMDATASVDDALAGRVAGVSVTNQTNAAMKRAIEEEKPMLDESSVETSTPPSLRQNFSETAFFYPHLKTDKDGTVSFTFTMPDALTRWKFMALAHTKDLHQGYLSQIIVTQLPFTLKPTLPRFVRVGDEQHFTATINNLSGEARNVAVKMVLSDAESGTEVMTAEKNIALTGKQEMVDFSFVVPDKVAALDVKMYAVSDSVSDGEQRQLAVLPRGMRVNKSVNVIAKKGEQKTVKLPAIEPEAENKAVTLEYSANAAWNALMAMPKVSYNSENAIDMAIAVYVNGLSQDIGEKYPSIKTAVEQWQKTDQGEARSASPLELNAELKNVILNETPWVKEAKKETEWRKSVAEALDPVRAKKDNIAIMRDLKKLQNHDGGFAWWSGMPSSLFTSISVAEQLSRLNSRGLLGSVKGGKEMLNKLLPYLDEEVKKDYYWQKKYSKKIVVNEWHIHLLMIRLESLGVKSMPSDVKQIYDEYIKEAKNRWRDFTLYGKACFALALEFDKDKVFAKDVVDNLRETISVDENGARYWKSNVETMNWYGSDVRSHAMAMAALAKIDRNADEQDDLALWLLLRKRTTMWASSVASVDAITSIINSNAEGVKSMVEPAPSELTWGTRNISTAAKNGEIGEQYVKQSVAAQDYREDLTSLSVSQSKDVPGYGALYISYDCPYEAVKRAKSGISVEKKTYLCQKAGEGETREVLSAVKPDEVLHVGDKIKVVLSVKVDQTLDFVCLKDLRAACCEPGVAVSGYYRADNTYCYRSFTDSSVRFFFDRLNKGTYVFEYTMYVTHRGTYGAGVATVQCQYAPSYQGNSTSGLKLKVE